MFKDHVARVLHLPDLQRRRYSFSADLDLMNQSDYSGSGVPWRMLLTRGHHTDHVESMSHDDHVRVVLNRISMTTNPRVQIYQKFSAKTVCLDRRLRPASDRWAPSYDRMDRWRYRSSYLSKLSSQVQFSFTVQLNWGILFCVRTWSKQLRIHLNGIRLELTLRYFFCESQHFLD
jgi:hypothetical protein